MSSAITEDILEFCWQAKMGILTVYHQMSSAITEDILEYCWQAKTGNFTVYHQLSSVINEDNLAVFNNVIKWYTCLVNGNKNVQNSICAPYLKKVAIGYVKTYIFTGFWLL